MSTNALLDVFSLPHLLRRLRPGGRKRVVTQLCLLLLIIPLTSVGGVAYAQDASVVGQWETLTIPAPVVGIHAIVLWTGKVLLYSSGSTAHLWDPTSDPTSDPESAFEENYVVSNIFCSGHCSLADGRVLVIGQDDNVNIFDPISESWSEVASMETERYYPTCTSLPDGRALAMAGKGSKDIPGVYDPGTNTWEQLNNAKLRLPFYPWMFVLPSSGLVFNAGPNQTTRTLDVATQTWEEVGDSIFSSRRDASAVALVPGKIFIVGGATPTTATAEIINLTPGEADPAWQYTAPMHHARRNHNATLLPDGKVLVTGGANKTGAVLVAEMFDPAEMSWTEMAPMQFPRLYHSTAFLLPDGRVVVTGTDSEFTLEIFSPPYLFQGAPRPTIISVPPDPIVYGSDFTVETDVDASSIISVALMRPSAVTHSFNEDQSYVPLTFTADSSSQLSVDAPMDATWAPPGYYMLFIVDDLGVPSKARFIQLPDVEVGTPPIPPPIGTMHVDSIGLALVKRGPNLKATAFAEIVEVDGGPSVSNATVTGDWRLNGTPVKIGASGTTGTDGIATIESGRIRDAQSGSDIISFCVTTVTHSGLDWDNVMPCSLPEPVP